MYSASVPGMAKTLANMLAWLDKAQAHADTRKFDSKNYLQLRLAPDMLPFAKQVQITCDTAKGCARRLAGVEAPVHDDSEQSLDELRRRIRETIAFVESVAADRIAGSEARAIEIPARDREPRKFNGETYLRHFALPNFYFHAAMAYALLRHAGVELGKSDFLGV
jgi:hypothetical protein